MIKRILVLTGEKWSDVPFSKDSYKSSYETLYSLAEKNGIKMYKSSYREYSGRKKYFKRAWTFDKTRKSWTVAKKVLPHAIFDKTSSSPRAYYEKELIRKNYPFFNSLEFTKLVRNKLTVGMLFERWSKKNRLVSNKAELKKNLPQIRTSKVVLKPIRGGGGKNIYILDKKTALQKAFAEGLYIAQEFIDSSAGVPGVSKSMHDLRLVIINGKIIYAYIREPKSGSFLANCAQGGTLKIVPLSKLPKTVFPIVEHANEIFAAFCPRFYSIDLMFDRKKKPWVVELNAMPGLNLCAEKEKPFLLKLYAELIKIFISIKKS